MTLKISINHNTFILHCTGAMYWAEKKMLLISDVHLGKVSHFRKHGSALPDRAKFKNFAKLDAVTQFFKPESICFLGDLFHSKVNNEWELFSDWALQVKIPLVLVAGNHDIIAPMHYEALGISVCSESITGGFLLTHHPEEREGLFNLSGHIHPGVRLEGFGRQFLKLPCFFYTPQQMILPAFGEFTGMYLLEPAEHTVIYAITKEDVVKVEVKEQQ